MNAWFNEPQRHHIVGQYGKPGPFRNCLWTVQSGDVTELEIRNLGSIINASDHGSYREDRNGGLKGNKGSNFQFNFFLAQGVCRRTG